MAYPMQESSANMEVSVTILFAFIVFFLAFYHFRYAHSDIPTVGLLEFIPNGLMYPVLKDPQDFQLALRSIVKRYGRVFNFWFGVRYTLATAVPEDLVHILTSEKFERPDNIHYVFEIVSPGGILSMPREKHKVLRKTFRERLSKGMLQRFERHMNDAITELCDTLTDATMHLEADGNTKIVDVSEVMTATAFRIMTDIAFASSIDKEEREEFERVTGTYFEESFVEILNYPFRQYLAWFGTRKRFFECKRKMDGFTREFIRRRLAESEEERKARKSDILDIFVSLYGNDEKVLNSLLVSFVMAGSQTASVSLAWAIYETCCNERVVSEIDRELESVLHQKPLDEPITLEELGKLRYIHKVWRETLRLHTIGPGIARMATSDVTLKGSGVRIPKGGDVMALFSVVHMDEEIWSEPNVFKPERWGHGEARGEGDRVRPGAYMPYGHGFRDCIGKFLAEHEGPFILAELHRRFRLSLACKADEVITRTAIADEARYSSKSDGNFDMGVPVRVEMKRRT